MGINLQDWCTITCFVIMSVQNCMLFMLSYTHLVNLFSNFAFLPYFKKNLLEKYFFTGAPAADK